MLQQDVAGPHEQARYVTNSKAIGITLRSYNVDHCQRGVANLLTMAITNIATDVGLIVLPIPVLWNMTLSWYK